MAPLTNIRFVRDDLIYQLDIEFDDEAMMDDQLSFEAKATVTDREGRSHSETLRVEMDWSENTVTVKREGKILHQFRLDNLTPGINEETGEEVIPDFDDVGDVISEIIGAIPVPDPILGCLLKAGVSSIVGQAINCNNRRDGYEGKTRVGKILRCLKRHAISIGFNTLKRTLKCMLRFGF